MIPANQNSSERTTFSQFYDNVVYEEGQDFLDYLICLGLLGESNSSQIIEKILQK
jgi:hypothetical protein